MAQLVTQLVAARLDAALGGCAGVVDDRPIRSAAPSLSRRRALAACGASALLHAAAVVALGVLVVDVPPEPTWEPLAASVVPDLPVEIERLPDVRPVDPQPTVALDPAELASATSLAPAVAAPRRRTTVAAEPAPAPGALDVYSSPQLLVGFDPREHKTKLNAIRSPAQRSLAVYYRGGNAESEQAVSAALAWLAKHQQADGGWSFDHRGGDCKGRCRNPGSLQAARGAATALALLPFLAAGQTHKQGSYRREVEAGLKFLVRQMQTTQYGGSYTHGGGTMYAQGLATIALCEALAMTRDKDLIAPAQAATSFIINTQDPQGGGWRYFPGMPGDTSVTGWQLMALKSADNAYIAVPAATIDRMRAFFDFVQQDDGAAYGYFDSTLATTASTPVGLLCRMHLGRERDDPALVRGVTALAAAGPSPDNVYFNFYATQVLHHYGGPLWDQWNTAMRDGLVAAQAREGHEAGSWFAVESGEEDRQASILGGRLYTTCLAALTLEVYYRYLPLYGNRIWLGDDG